MMKNEESNSWVWYLNRLLKDYCLPSIVSLLGDQTPKINGGNR